MADPLDITLHASAAETSSGTSAAGDVVDIEAHRACVRVRLDVSVITGVADSSTDYLTVTVQTAPDATNGPWRDVGSFDAQSAVGSALRQTFGPCDRYVRLSWTLAGAVSSATFAVYGEAHQLFCTPDDVKELAIRAAALDLYTDNALCGFCLRGSDKTYSALSASAEPPITAWSREIVGATADLAAYYALKARGINPDGPDKELVRAAAAAEKYLQRIAEGLDAPADVTDQTPDDYEGGALVSSDAQRGWGGWQ